MWYVISEYADAGDFEIVSRGTEGEAKEFFKLQLESEHKIATTDIRNITDFQFEVWIKEHYQNKMMPGLAYTIRLTDTLPTQKKH